MGDDDGSEVTTLPRHLCVQRRAFLPVLESLKDVLKTCRDERVPYHYQTPLFLLSHRLWCMKIGAQDDGHAPNQSFQRSKLPVPVDRVTYPPRWLDLLALLNSHVGGFFFFFFLSWLSCWTLMTLARLFFVVADLSEICHWRWNRYCSTSRLGCVHSRHRPCGLCPEANRSLGASLFVCLTTAAHCGPETCMPLPFE